MKLPITEEFLWEVYNFLEKAGEIHDEFFLFPSKQLRSLRYSVEIDRLRKKYERKKAKTNFSQFVYYLKKKGYIKIKSLEGKRGIILTKKGAGKALETKFKIEKKKKRKDGKWIMLMFDIPEKQRKIRDLFRSNLYFLGFKMLQQSVWICPYDVLEEVDKIVREKSLDAYIKLFLVEEIEIS